MKSLNVRIERGVSRIVILVGNWAIKLPYVREGQRYFVQGMLGNVVENHHWRTHRHPSLAPVYFCAPLGLLLVMKRFGTVLDRLLTDDEIGTIPFYGIDNNGSNIALENGKFVVIDYGNEGIYFDYVYG